MKSTKLLKMICLIISLAMVFPVSALAATDEVDVPVSFEADEHNHSNDAEYTSTESSTILFILDENGDVGIIQVAACNHSSASSGTLISSSHRGGIKGMMLLKTLKWCM